MLSVASVRSASGAASYFAKDDYYTAEQSAELSEWGGAAAESVGLAGDVGKDAFEGVLGGILPDGTHVAPGDKRQAGTDLTFSMPKSASIMAYVAGDARILAVNRAAVRATMAWVEKNLAEGRRDVDGRKVPIRTGNLVYALFQHDTSRALDPQAHIHAVIANLTRMPDGRMQALHNGAIWRANTTIGAIYHAELRAGLERLGYGVELKGKHGTFEIDGVPRGVIDAFSQRRDAILTRAETLGVTASRSRDGVAVNTRNAKVVIDDRDSLRDGWRARAAALGFDGTALREAARVRASATHPAETASGAGRLGGVIAAARVMLADLARPHDPLVDSGLARSRRPEAEVRTQLAVGSAVRILAEREAAFGTHLLAKTALDLALPGVTISEVERRIDVLTDQGRLIPEVSRRDDGAITMLTTPDALATEERILALVRAGQGRGSALLDAAAAQDRLGAAADQPLNPGQLAAATMILSTDDRTVVVQGVAGAGKSTMLAAVARVAESEGREVLGLAFQNKMVGDLAAGAGIRAETVATFVRTHERLLDHGTASDVRAARAALARTIVVVDESSMVSSEDTRSLLEIARAFDVEKLILVGDRQQLASIDAGKAFAMIQAGGGRTARMDTNLRQRTDQLRSVAALANLGRASGALRLLGDDVIEHAAPADHAAERWLALSPADREATAVFASGRAARAQINDRIQAGLVAEGSVGGAGVRLTVEERVNTTREELRLASTYRPGQVLVAAGRVDTIGLSRGAYNVRRVLADGRVDLTMGRRAVRIDPARLPVDGRRTRLELVERKPLTLYEGDRIRWTANDKGRGLHNAGTARIVAIGAAGVTIETASREQLTLPRGDPMLTRLNLAYALNMHMAQGITTDRAIAVMASYERFLSNQRLFNVTVTRVRDQLTLVVDDRERLSRQLDRTPGDKSSALETVGFLDIDRRAGRAARVAPGVAAVRNRDRWSPDAPATGNGGLGLADRSDLRPDKGLSAVPERQLGLGL